MKVLQINSVCGVGSTGRIATDIYRLLNEEGQDCKILYGRGSAPEGVESIKIGSTFNNYYHVYKTRVFDKHGFASKKATIEAIEKIEEYNPDIIHLHNIHGYYINIELLFNYLKKINKPVVWTLHDCWPFTGHCAYFDFANCDKWKLGCNNCSEKKEYPGSILLDNSKANYNKKKEIFTSINNMTIITPSKWLANVVEQSFLSCYPIKVINNGIDLKQFKPTDSNFRDKNNLNHKFIILGVASVWDKRKGLKYFEELQNVLSEEYKIVLVGVDEKQKNNLNENILSISRTNNVKELAEIYSSADVFINPTLEDNFPTTNLESIACSTPVITFETGGSVESVDEKSGAIVEKEDIESLVKEIELIKSKTNNQKMEQREYCKLKSLDYDKDKKFKEYLQLYKVIVDSDK